MYCVPELLAEGTHNICTVSVLAEQQDEGIGAELVASLEVDLCAVEQRLLIVVTSGTDTFALPQGFYTQLNYHHEATIRDFWVTGNDKVVFRKLL